MKAVCTQVYEIDRNDVAKLPYGFEVLEINTLYESAQIKYVGQDRFRWNTEYKHYLIKIPPLPALSVAENRRKG